MAEGGNQMVEVGNIQINNVNKSFDEVHVLNDFHLILSRVVLYR